MRNAAQLVARRDRDATAVDDEHAGSRPESRRGDHVAHEAEIERRHEHAHELAGAAARLHHEVDLLAIARGLRVADVAAEAVRSDVDAFRDRIAVAELAVGVEDRQPRQDRNVAPQSPQ